MRGAPDLVIEVLQYTLSEGQLGLPMAADLRSGVTAAIFSDLRVRVRPAEV